MRGVTLLAGLALLGSLAVPAALPASEHQAPAPAPATDPAGTEATPAGDEAQPPATEDDGPEPPATEDDGPQPPATEDDGSGPPATAYSHPTKAERRESRPQRDARAGATTTVLMQDIKFKPRKITIDPGDTVEWENRDEARHDAIGENGTFDTPIIERGETSSHSFNRKGRFPYFCSIHEGMTGTIQVGASSSGGGAVGGGGAALGGGDGSGGTSAIGSNGAGSSGSFGSTGSGGTSSTLPATGSELLWLGLIGYGLVAVGAFVRLAAIGR